VTNRIGPRPLRVLTWHVHGNYLWYLSTIPHELYLPVVTDGDQRRGGRGTTFPFPDTVIDVPVDEVPDLDVDVVLFQSHENWLRDQFCVLSEAQRSLPRIFIEHDPPRQSPTDTVHPVDDPEVVVVHVTPFNQLMWDNGDNPTTVIEHGVITPPDVRYTGELDRGIVVVNGLAQRGRRLGSDVFEAVRGKVPLDLVGIDAERAGGLGEIAPPALARFEARYRFFFNPIRYTSLGLAVCEAMMLGMPIVGLATTEMATVVENGVSGYVDTKIETLVDAMRALLDDPGEACRLGQGARAVAQERFGIDRFTREWDELLRAVA
jgi:hypothetical protein